MIIKNTAELTSHGFKKGRKAALEICEYAIQSANAADLTKILVSLKGHKLEINGLHLDLAKRSNVYVIGGGKASYSIGKAIEEILGDNLSGGIIIVKKGERRRLRKIKVVEAGHPVPDENGYKATREIINIARKAGQDDLIICAITGGASALMPQPEDGISMLDLKKINQLLLDCGAPIEDINAVRNHISKIKGGRLARMVQPATLVSLILIDEIAGEPWGPTVGDKTTFDTAIRALKKHKLWDAAPESIKAHLIKGKENPSMESLSPEEIRELEAHNIILGNNISMCEAAQEKAEALGLNSLILTCELEGESREVGISLAGIAKEISRRHRPLKPPCAVIAGGETTVKIQGNERGLGGPCQEFALGASLKISGQENIVVCAIGTDGTDGPTPIAGAIVDGRTMQRAEETGIDIFDSLSKHDSSHVVIKLKDALYTHPTDTNVMDLYAMVIF
ncbi:MAG: glycerate kinase [bacterium]